MSKYQTQQQDLWKLFNEFNERDTQRRNEKNEANNAQQQNKQDESQRNQSHPRKKEQNRAKEILASPASSQNQDMTSASTITTLLMKQKVSQ
jgi:FtsZ-interacting cell division protein YlmF